MSTHVLYVGVSALYEYGRCTVPCTVTKLAARRGGMFDVTVVTTTASRFYRKNTEITVCTSIDKARQGQGVYPRTAGYWRGGLWCVSYFTVDFKERAKT